MVMRKENHKLIVIREAKSNLMQSEKKDIPMVMRKEKHKPIIEAKTKLRQ